MQETQVWSLVWDDPMEKDMATHSSSFAWRIPWTEEHGGLQSTGLQRVGHDWVTNTHTWVYSLVFVHMCVCVGGRELEGEKSPMNISKIYYQIRSVAQLCLTLCDPMNCSTPCLPVRHQLPEFTQTHVHRVGDAIQPSHPLSSPSPLAPNPSQHQSLLQWVNSSHEAAKVLEFQL